MENNLFENAKFRDLFLTRNGTIAVYIASYHNIEHTYALPNWCTVHWCKNDGTNCAEIKEWDIVSRYQKTINENKLDELHNIALNKTYTDTNNPLECAEVYWYEQGLIDGYSKAMESD